MLRDLRVLLNSVERPGRYVGGEFGALRGQPNPDDLTVCVAFPDLYEIGMSNQAIRILYNHLNAAEGIHAERAFSPAEDFARELRESRRWLFTLENGLEVRRFDVLAITVGYELSMTNVLEFLDASGIPVRRTDRERHHPLVILGGPAVTNPAPWTPFVDGVFIGESEGVLTDILSDLRHAEDPKHRLAEYEGFWTPDHPSARRVVWQGFAASVSEPASWPVPSMVTVQDHGVIEIMRGCPNKCRFCHAGVFYRPFRQKPVGRILDEARLLVDLCGYRDITLASLSTGDYSGLEPLVEELNRRYAERHVSFSLPSLRVNSITLSLIGSLRVVRKSGLTFAVETPTLEGQRGINKEVPQDRVVDILREARRQGWNLAKFYFMLGLPVDAGEDEATQIVQYLLNVQNATGMKLNVNLGTFIPKPHTPYERAFQLTDTAAMERIRRIRDGLRSNKKIRFSFHSPFVSFLEGIISRGDERAGELAYDAWRRGAAFDAWDDRMNKDAWREAIAGADWSVEHESCRSRDDGEALPWDGVDMRVSADHLVRERQRSESAELTSPCAGLCADHCGVCGRDCRVDVTGDLADFIDSEAASPAGDEAGLPPSWRRLLLRFVKKGPAVYLSHLDVMSVFERSLQRAGLHVDFTRGYNPKPRIEFAQPLSLGLFSEDEICTVRLNAPQADADDVRQAINASLPDGFAVSEAWWIAPTPEGRKVRKVMSAFWGSDWSLAPDPGLSEVSVDAGALGELGMQIEGIGRQRGISEDVRTWIDGNRLIVRLRSGGTRNHNLLRILEGAFEGKPLCSPYLLTRIKSWSSDGEGRRVSFEEAFPPAYLASSQ